MTFRLRLAALAAAATAALLPAPALMAQPAPAAPAAAPSPPPAPYGEPINRADARRALDAALAFAERNGWPVAVAIVDPHGELIAFARMDGANWASGDVAQQKARTAARFRRDTKAFADNLAGAMSFEDVAMVEGGVVIEVGGRIIGAVGVSGVTSAQDAEVGRAGIAALGR